MDFFEIVCGAAALLWLAAGALAVEDHWRQRRLTQKSEEALDKLLEEVFGDELADRCARYAEEIAVLQEKQRWVDAKERQPEYGVSVLAVASGKAANITLCDTIVFATFWDGWELDDYPQAENVDVKWWRPMVESPEEVNDVYFDE